ncbi:MAG: DUF4157 domain-containing protein [Pseudomonadota bacterium]
MEKRPAQPERVKRTSGPGQATASPMAGGAGQEGGRDTGRALPLPACACGGGCPRCVGRALPMALRGEFEGLFGESLGHVRLHTDSRADSTARSLGARAMSLGSHIAFGAGQFRPEDPAGRALLAHELAHVLQSRGQAAGVLSGVATRTSPAEREARDIARAYRAGAPQLRPREKPPAGRLHLEEGQDEEVDEGESLPLDYARVRSKNRYWWSRLGLGPIRPFASLTPDDLPNAFANETYRLQRYAHASGADAAILGLAQDPDGVFGPRTYVMLLRLAEEARDKPAVAEAISKSDIGHLLPSILAADRKAVDVAWNRALADIEKPDFKVRWNVSVACAALWDFWASSFELGDEMRSRVDSLLFSGKPPEGTRDEDRFAILKGLYGQDPAPGVAALFEANRDFIHHFDLDRLADTAKLPPGSSWHAFLGLAGAGVVDAALDKLALEPPPGADSERLLAEIHAGETVSPGASPAEGKARKKHIAALGLVYFLPKRSPGQIGEAVRAHFYERQLGEAATDQAAAEWLANFSASVEKRLGGQPDIEDYDTLLELLAGPAGAPVRDPARVAALADRAEETLGLVVRLGDEASPTFLPWPNIRQLRRKAMDNAGNVLRFGLFKPPPDSPLNLDKEGFTARRRDDANVELARTVSKLTWDSARGEGHGNVWADWKHFDKEVFGNLEPVRLRLGELDPHTTFWVKRYRDVIGENEWIVQEMWVLGGNLPDISEQLWDKVNADAVVGLIDAALSLLAAASLVAGPLIALEAGAASAATAMTTGQIALTLTRSFVQRAFWFVVSEALAQRFLDLDHAISTDKVGYTDNDREHWRYFKVGLLVLAGSLLLRQAWRGLKGGASAGLKTSLAEIEKEIAKAELKTEGGVAGAAGKGLVQAESAVGKRATELVEAAGATEVKAGTATGEALAGAEIRTAGFTDKVLASGPVVAERSSAVAADAAGTPYLQYAGQPVRGYIGLLREQLERLAPASRGTTGAELDLLDAQVRELEAGLAKGSRVATSEVFQAEMSRLLTRLEGIAGKQGLENLDQLTVRSMMKFMFGQKTVPVQAELDALVDAAWKQLKGKNRPTAIIDPKMSSKTDGWFRSWVGKFGEIAVNAQAQTKGQLADTAYHEAMHARLRELFPFLKESGSKHPYMRLAFRHLDEIIAYAYGGVGRIRHGGVADKLFGLAEISASPWLAYGSANNLLEATPGIIRDAIGITLYVYALVRLFESAGPQEPAPKVAPGTGSGP